MISPSLMYTSGTSGLPKGVCLTYNNLQSDVDASIEQGQLKSRHRFLGVIPLFHAPLRHDGHDARADATRRTGGLPRPLLPRSPALNAFREHKISIMFGVPSMFAAMAHLKNATREDFASAYALITGGEPQPGALRDRLPRALRRHAFLRVMA